MYIRYFIDGGQSSAGDVILAPSAEEQAIAEQSSQPTNFGDIISNLSTSDKQRLSSVLLDILAVIDPESISSVGLGLVSDYLNTKADIKDYGWNKRTFRNLITNASLSLLGGLPVVGQTLASSSKATIKFMKTAPLLVSIATMAASSAGTMDIGRRALKSLNHIQQKNYDVTDLRNIAMFIQTIFSIGNIYRRSGIASKKLEKTANIKWTDAANAQLDLNHEKVWRPYVNESEFKAYFKPKEREIMRMKNYARNLRNQSEGWNNLDLNPVKELYRLTNRLQKRIFGKDWQMRGIEF